MTSLGHRAALGGFLWLASGCGPALSVAASPASTAAGHPETRGDPQVVLDARAMHRCDGEGAGGPACALLDRFARAETTPIDVEGRSYLGHATCAGGETVDLVEAALFVPVPTPSVFWRLMPTEEPAGPRVAAIREVLGRPTYDTTSFDPDDTTIESDIAQLLRTRGHFLPYGGTVAVRHDDDTGTLVADRENWGRVHVRAEGDLLLVIEPLAITPPTICVGELAPFRTYEIDTGPVVTCLSELTRRPTATGYELDECEDDHTYAIHCEAARCDCTRDGASTAAIEVDAATPITDAMRYGCGFPVQPSR